MDFQLADEPSGLVSGTVTITGGGLENYAKLSFREEAVCPTCVNGELIEVKGINMLNGAVYTVALPPGDYTLVASSFGYATQTLQPVSVTVENPEQPTVADIDF